MSEESAQQANSPPQADQVAADAAEIEDALGDTPIVKTLPDAVKELTGFRQREVKALRRYRAKLKEQIDEIKGLLRERDSLLAELGQQRADAEAAAVAAGESRAAAEAAHEHFGELIAQADTAIANATQLQPKLDTLTEQCSQIEARAQTAAERSQHIEDGFQYVQRTRPDVEQAANKIEKLHTDAKALADEAVQREGRLEALETAAEDAKDAAESSADSVEAQVQMFSKRNTEVASQQEELLGLVKKAGDLARKVESLLPGATSAGLASSFKNRATELNSEIRFWHGISLVSLLALTAYALYYGDELLVPVGGIESWPALVTRIVLKALIALPLVWLALVAGGRGTLAKRVREDYRYKAAQATAFDGFKKQLSDIESEGEPPVVGLARNLLESLAAQPGRLYDAKHQEVTPLSAAVNVISNAASGKRAKISTPGIEAEVDGRDSGETER